MLSTDLRYLECQHHLELNTNVEESWYKPNFSQNNKPAVYKMSESRDWIVLQGRCSGSLFIFFFMHHSEELMKKRRFVVTLNIHGELQGGIISQGISKVLRCASIGIGLEDAFKQNYTLSINHGDMEKICARQHTRGVHSKKYKLFVRFSVMEI